MYQMVGIMDIYKSLNISMGAVIKNPKMVTFVPDHYKTQIYDKATLENSGILKSVPHW